MASCKDCIHCEMCTLPNAFNEIICNHFKDRNKFVELPCMVGDTVYVKMQFGGYAEGLVRDYSYFITCGFCVVVTGDKFCKQNIPFSEFGKTIFLTSEEAEKALKERTYENT